MVKMEEQTEKQIRRRYVSTGGEEPRRRRSGFLPGLLVGFLVAVIAVGIFFALRGGSGAASPIASSSGSGGAVDAQAVNKLKLLEQYIDYYYYKSDEVSKEDMQKGVYFGIGAYVSKDVESGACVISGVIKDTPAEAAGLMEGDVIYSVEGKEMNGLELEEVVSYIKGDEGTKVHITIYRNGEPIEMELTRARVTSPTVDSEMKENGIGYLQITEFDDVTTAQFEENFASLKEQGMKGLIIDLRSNPGGNVTTVCEIAEKLLPEGLVFYMEDKNGKRTEYPCKGADFDLPLVVLVNEYSASAAEILSGAIKDAGIGKLVGKKTFGKGIVQTVAPLDDGSAIKLTIANYYTRNGNDIHLKGIEPDIEVDMDADAYLENKIDTQLEKAIEVLTEMMNGGN